MKNLLILPFLFIVMILSSCKKDGNNDDNASGTMTAQLDGVTTTFNVGAMGVRRDAFQIYTISVIGFQGIPGSSDQMSIILSSTAEIVPGTYAETGSGNSTGFVYLKSGSTYPYTDVNNVTNPTIIKITAVSATSVQGTFSGDIYLNSETGVTSTKKVVSNGQFNVKF